MTDTRIDLDDARRAILADTEPVGGHEIVATDEAVGRVLGRAVEAPLSLPPFPASAMDGYALRSRDVAGEPPYRLHVAGVSYAGHPLEGVVPPGTCVRIFTGAAMPEGLDAVVIQEDCVRRGDEVVVSEPVAAGQNVRPIAHDVAAGSCLFDAGHRLGEFDTAWLAACGISAVTVHRRPLVAIFSTGDELTEPGDHLGPGRIFDANRHALRTLLAHLPVDVEDLGIVDDSREAIRKTLEYADTSCDVVVTSGGVSVGDADWVRGVVDEIGHLRLWKLNLKPGKPLAYGRLRKAAFFGLPGNPVSSIVTALMLLKPALERWCGAWPSPPLMVPATLRQPLRHAPGREEFQRGCLTYRDGRLEVSSSGDQSSNRLSSFARADCLIRIPKESPDLPVGARVTVIPFRGLL